MIDEIKRLEYLLHLVHEHLAADPHVIESKKSSYLYTGHDTALEALQIRRTPTHIILEEFEFEVQPIVDRIVASEKHLQKRARHLKTAYHVLCTELLERNLYVDYIEKTGRTMVTFSEYRMWRDHA